MEDMLISEPEEGGTDKSGRKGGRVPHAMGAAGETGQHEHMADRPERGMLPWRQPGVLQGEWEGQTLSHTPNVRNMATIHVISASTMPIRCINTKKVDCYRLTARVKATGGLVAVEVPCAVGTPACIFRDIPELEPYFPPPITTLDWLNTTRFLATIQLHATTMSIATRRERERMGLVFEDHEEPEDDIILDE